MQGFTKNAGFSSVAAMASVGAIAFASTAMVQIGDMPLESALVREARAAIVESEQAITQMSADHMHIDRRTGTLSWEGDDLQFRPGLIAAAPPQPELLASAQTEFPDWLLNEPCL